MVGPGFRLIALKPVRNRPLRKAFRLRPAATSHFLALVATWGCVLSTCQWTSFDTYWKVLTSLSMPSLFARKITSLSTVSFMVESCGRKKNEIIWLKCGGTQLGLLKECVPSKKRRTATKIVFLDRTKLYTWLDSILLSSAVFICWYLNYYQLQGLGFFSWFKLENHYYLWQKQFSHLYYFVNYIFWIRIILQALGVRWDWITNR